MAEGRGSTKAENRVIGGRLPSREAGDLQLGGSSHSPTRGQGPLYGTATRCSKLAAVG